MRRFLCPACGNELHFGNTQCVQCSALVGYLPSGDYLFELSSQNGTAGQGEGAPRPCANRAVIHCNWLCESDGDSLCFSCRLTTKIPDISNETNRIRWGRLERAKRRLVYSLLKLRLPLDRPASGAEQALRFELLGDEIDRRGKLERVMTGHAQGRITINIAEADDAIREKTRTDMGEPYRTLIGHFRHEVGHYYWDKLVAGKPVEAACRACFGDERRSYSEALETYYRDGPAPDWQARYVSAYASAHPWEDFAETWSHYLHMVAGLEAAYAYGLNPQPMQADQPRRVQFENPYHVENGRDLIDHWIPLTVAMNAMNRAVGNHDFYPFALTPAILDKLVFIHDLIAANEAPQARSPSS